MKICAYINQVFFEAHFLSTIVKWNLQVQCLQVKRYGHKAVEGVNSKTIFIRSFETLKTTIHKKFNSRTSYELRRQHPTIDGVGLLRTKLACIYSSFNPKILVGWLSEITITERTKTPNFAYSLFRTY